jgi:hypothetical protein
MKKPYNTLYTLNSRKTKRREKKRLERSALSENVLWGDLEISGKISGKRQKSGTNSVFNSVFDSI